MVPRNRRVASDEDSPAGRGGRGVTAGGAPCANSVAIVVSSVAVIVRIDRGCLTRRALCTGWNARCRQGQDTCRLRRCTRIRETAGLQVVFAVATGRRGLPQP